MQKFQTFMQNKYNSYNTDEQSSMLNETMVAYASPMPSNKRRVNTQDLMADGCMTLAQSKAMIKEKIYNHFHK